MTDGEYPLLDAPPGVYVAPWPARGWERMDGGRMDERELEAGS